MVDISREMVFQSEPGLIHLGESVGFFHLKFKNFEVLKKTLAERSGRTKLWHKLTFKSLAEGEETEEEPERDVTECVRSDGAKRREPSRRRLSSLALVGVKIN